MGVWELTDIVYGIIAFCLVAAITYAVVYSLKQRANLQAAERNGVRPTTSTEAILIAQRYKQTEKHR